MPIKQFSWDDIFTNTPLSEPLTTYKDNIEAIVNLIGTSLHAIKQKEELTRELLKEVEKFSEEMSNDTIPHYIEMRDKPNIFLREIDRFQKRAKTEMSEEDLRRYETLVKDAKNLRKDINNEIRRVKISYKKNVAFSKTLSQRIQSHNLEKQLLRPMSFVYLVTVWDAFILDTARKILHKHPNLISDSDSTIEFSKSSIWSLDNIDELRNYLIETEVRNLDNDRKKLINCFKEYWGIDWEQSPVSQDDIKEIRARRDIWVHNRGIVNQQYLSMVGDSTKLELDNLAEITDEYLTQSLAKLTNLAIYIHKIAHEKHYSQAK